MIYKTEIREGQRVEIIFDSSASKTILRSPYHEAGDTIRCDAVHNFAAHIFARSYAYCVEPWDLFEGKLRFYRRMRTTCNEEARGMLLFD